MAHVPTKKGDIIGPVAFAGSIPLFWLILTFTTLIFDFKGEPCPKQLFLVLDATNDFSELLGVLGVKKIEKFQFSPFFTMGGQLRARTQ